MLHALLTGTVRSPELKEVSKCASVPELIELLRTGKLPVRDRSLRERQRSPLSLLIVAVSVFALEFPTFLRVAIVFSSITARQHHQGLTRGKNSRGKLLGGDEKQRAHTLVFLASQLPTLWPSHCQRTKRSLFFLFFSFFWKNRRVVLTTGPSLARDRSGVHPGFDTRSRGLLNKKIR